MKNLLLLSITALCLYLYFNPKPEPEQPVAQVAPRAVASARPYYYHSPLEAPAMPVGVSTGGGYYSADPSGRFNNYQYHSATNGGAPAAGGSIGYGGSSSTYNTTVSGSSRGAGSYNSGTTSTSYLGSRANNYVTSSDANRTAN